MREILFRGKQVFFNDWIEGTGIFNDGINTWLSFNEPKKAIAYGLNHKRVHAETIGQFTGLTDKNGKKIFEGDVVNVLQGKDKGVACVGFENGAFMLYPRTGNIYERTLWAYWYNDWDVEIIGNIHDNPELLENP